MDEVLMEVPGEIPHPDGLLLLERAGQRRRAAFEKYIGALRKYKQALKQGGVPPEPSLRTRKKDHSD